MLQTVAGMLIAFFCVVGAVGIIKWAALRIAAPRCGAKRVYAVLLRGDDADIELQMAMETLEWDSALAGAFVYAVDCGLDADTRDLCETMCEHSRFTYISAEQFGTIATENTDFRTEP